MKDHNSLTNNCADQNQKDSNGLQLDQMAPCIGEPIQLQIGNTRHFVTFIGHLKGQGFIVTMPNENSPPIQLDKGLSLVACFSVDKRSYAFNTSVCSVSNEPFPHLHLAYPKEVRALKERLYDRIGVNLAGVADISDGESLSCVVRDISIGGALIALHDQTAGVNEPLLLTLRVVINGVEYELSLNSEIRSVRVGDSSGGGETLFLHGLAFNDLSERDILALAAFDLLPDLNTAP